MANYNPSSSKLASTEADSNKYLRPLILVTSLFFMWGLAYGLLDVLNKHFQEALQITKQRSTLLQASYFGAYFLMAWPAGMFMKRSGYKKGIILGLALYACGAFMFYPSASMHSFPFFLLSLFTLASGLTFLETAANPYVTVLGKPQTAELRLNLSQSFNGVGAFLGPIIGGALFFKIEHQGTGNLDSVKFVYLLIGVLVLFIVFLFVKTNLPEIIEEESHISDGGAQLGQRHFIWSVIAQFFYVAAQVGMAALFINYCTEKDLGFDNEKASYLLSASLFMFTVGRFAGTGLMKFISPPNLLAIFALFNIVLCGFVVFQESMLAVYALVATFFFNSIMFPTIFALGIKNLGNKTKQGSSLLIMSIVGGAIMPYVMGSFTSTAFAYIVPLICFVVVFLFATIGHKVKG
jgi:MFS transporter, FHS family, L-fucose permease